MVRDVFLEIEEGIDSSRKKFNTFTEKDGYMVGHTDNGDFLFDEDDYEKVLSINKYWKINNIGYALCYIKGREYQLHRYLMGLGYYDKVTKIISDHISGDRLDCRKSNLRIIEKKHNAKNCSLYASNTSGVKGVSWNKKNEKWGVTIQVDKNQIFLGLHEDLDDAIKVRVDAEKKYFGEFRRII